MTCVKNKSRLVHAKRYLFLKSHIPPTQNITFSRWLGHGPAVGDQLEPAHAAASPRKNMEPDKNASRADETHFFLCHEN